MVTGAAPRRAAPTTTDQPKYINQSRVLRSVGNVVLFSFVWSTYAECEGTSPNSPFDTSYYGANDQSVSRSQNVRTYHTVDTRQTCILFQPLSRSDLARSYERQERMVKPSFWIHPISEPKLI